MIRFWGQPRFSMETCTMSGFELFIRQHDETTGNWVVPNDFSVFGVDQVTTLLRKTVAAMPSGPLDVSFNLDQEQFVDEAYCQVLSGIEKQSEVSISVELTERLGNGDKPLSMAGLKKAAKAYYDAGIPVILDDVGTGENQTNLVDALDPYVTEYKFALQNVRDSEPMSAIKTQVDFWRTLAKQHVKHFTIEGFEGPQDTRLIQLYKPNAVQGYYFGRPHVLPIAADFIETEFE
ncbi:EAL domain-containing protein [Secundilactobacillus similis]|nr:EAL domain-containing protein [Secundilactobacillus similis]